MTIAFRFLFIVVCALIVASHADAQDTKAITKKPNILVIFGDDIGWQNVSAYGMGTMGYKTPNIDRIANEGASSSTTTRSPAARPAARLSSPASTRSARA